MYLTLHLRYSNKCDHYENDKKDESSEYEDLLKVIKVDIHHTEYIGYHGYVYKRERRDPVSQDYTVTYSYRHPARQYQTHKEYSSSDQQTERKSEKADRYIIDIYKRIIPHKKNSLKY